MSAVLGTMFQAVEKAMAVCHVENLDSIVLHRVCAAKATFVGGDRGFDSGNHFGWKVGGV